MPETMDEITATIEAYRPRGFDTILDGPERLAWVARVVRQVGWDTSTKARQAMIHTWKFASWLAGSGVGLDARALTLARVDAFAASLPTPGSRDAARSYLRRVVGATTPADSGPAPAEDSSASVPTPLTAELSAEALSAELEGELDAVLAADGLLPEAAEFVRDVARRVQPTNSLQLRRVVRNVAPLVRMVVDQHRPLRVDVVFATGTIEHYLQGLCDGNATLKSVATYASVLYGIQPCLLPAHLRGSGARTPRGNKRVELIDESETTARQMRWARTRRNASTRRHSLALIALIRGAGADGGEAARVRAYDDVFTNAAGDVAVRLVATDGTARTVDLHDPWGPLLLACAEEARAANDVWLIGGSTSRRNRASKLAEHAIKCGLDVDLRRMRDTWRVERCLARDLPALLTELGLARPDSLQRLWPAIQTQARRS